jgi:hypothetical protein
MKFRITGLFYPTPGPPLATRLAGLAATGARTVGRIVAGKRARAAPQVVKERWAQCLGGCPHYDSSTGHCRLCGCRLRLKIPVAAARCPHWLAG